jgi:hypothetical protein
MFRVVWEESEAKAKNPQAKVLKSKDWYSISDA